MAGLEPASRRPGPTLSRYVAREALRPICIAVLGLTVVVLTRDLIGFTELVLNRGVGALEMSGSRSTKRCRSRPPCCPLRA
jgi:hypothetical protein